MNLKKQRLNSVKIDRVFSSCFNKKESSPSFQIHKNRKQESQWVVTGFMQDYNQ